MTCTPTPEQKAIISFARTSTRNLMIEALAGAAKTTTLVMIANEIPPVATLSLAFNKRIADEMKTRFPPHVDCLTLNSLGHRAWARAVGTKLVLDTKKSYGILKDRIDKLKGKEKDDAYERFSDLLRACDKSRLSGWVPDGKFQHAQRLTDNEQMFAQLEYEFIEGFPSHLQYLLINCVCDNITAAYKGVIDFNDQVYMPTLFGSPFARYPLVLADEVQDFSLLNHAMLSRVVGTRLIAVGDHFQSIYAFRGAATNSMDRLKQQFNMQTLPLSISFRCPRSVVKLAQFRASAMSAPAWAIDGAVSHLEDKWDAATIADGSAIICRNNAPLLATAMYLLRNKRGVRLLGSDIGPGLIKLLKKVGKNCSDRSALLTSIDEWRLSSIEKSKKDKIGVINDSADCLKVFAHEGTDITSAVAYAEHLFSSSGTIDLLSGHKSKGLEYDTVYHLDSWRIPSKYAKRAAESGNSQPLEQELNLRYVITTRAKKELHFITSKEREEYEQD